jgi:hypothetical protein
MPLDATAATRWLAERYPPTQAPDVGEGLPVGGVLSPGQGAPADVAVVAPESFLAAT